MNFFKRATSKPLYFLFPLFLFIVVSLYFFKKENIDKPRFQGPHKFAEYWSQIKGEGYYPGYRQVELNKMLSRLNQNRLTANIGIGDEEIRFGTSAAAVTTFTERGPSNVPGRTRGIVVDAGDASGNTWYVGSVGGGLWRGVYDNPGAGLQIEWTNLTPSTVSNIAITTVAQSANNANILYVGTGESWSYNVDAINGDGIFKVTLGGSDPIWTNVTPSSGGIIDSKFGNISRIIVDPANENIVLASTLANNGQSYIFKSINGGTSWTEVKLGGNRIQQIVASPSSFNTLYAAVRKKPVLKSTDAGDTWTEMPEFGIASNSYDRYELAVSHTDPNKIYAGIVKTFGSPGPSFLYRSLDGGSSWTHIPENTVSGDARYTTDFWLDSQGWYDNCITVHPFDDNIVYVGGIEIFKFTVLGDNTKNSTHLTDAYGAVDWKNYWVHVDQHFLGTIDDGGGKFRILNGSDGGVAVTLSATDPGNLNNTWANVQNITAGGYNTTQFYGADKVKGAHAYVGGAQDNGTWYSDPTSSASSSTSYSIGVGGDGLEVVAHWDNPDSLIGGSQYNNFKRSLDKGATWAYIGTPWTPHNGSGTGPFINRLSSSYQDADVVYSIGDAGIHKSKDFGGSWQLKVPPDIGGWDANDVEVSMANPRFVWAGGFISASGNLYLSKDWGNTFQAVANKPSGVSASISGIYSHPSEDSTVYVLFSNRDRGKIFETKDLGATWTDISGFPSNWTTGVSSSGFPNVAVTSLAVMPFDSDVIWAGTEIGLVETTNRGTSWSLVTQMPHVSIWDMKIKDQGEIVLATHGRGIWTATIPDLVSWNPKENQITLSVDTVNIAENGGVATLTVTAGKDVSPNGPITVNVSASGTATGPEYTLSSTSITLDSTSTTKTFTITSVNDGDQETDETVIIDISSVVNGKELGTQQVTVTIKDDDGPPTVSIAVDQASIAEAAGVSTITATLDKAPNSGDVVISLSTGGTAAASDYTLSSSTITIASGTTGTATITAIQDTEEETPDETVVIDISSVSNGSESGTQQVTVTITDDDGANTPPVVSIAVDQTNIAEAAGVSTITATLDKAPNSGDVVISLSTGGTAAASDYTLSSSTITIASGTTGTATVTAVQDTEDEDDETVIIDVSSVSNGSESGTQQVTVTITDDDDTVAGIEDLVSGKAISIYPNPNSGIFKVRFNDTWKGNVDLRVLDIFGRAQYLRRIDNTSGQVEHEVDISNKTDGLFFVELSQEDKRVIKKIFKK